MSDYRFHNSCVNWPRNDVNDGLIPMIDEARQITYRTLRKNIGGPNVDTLALNLGYRPHTREPLQLHSDWSVSFHRSKLHGQRVYYVEHSGIEYVFVPNHYSIEEQDNG